MNLIAYIEEFIKKISDGKIEIYNEASIQFEMAIFFREKIENNFEIQLERNVEFFSLDKSNYIKKEMDIVIFSKDMKEKYCIELKFPTNGQTPEQMFQTCKDIKFLEQLKESGFTSCYSIFFTDSRLFYDDKLDNKPNSIYKIFRGDRVIKNEIRKPTGDKNQVFNIEGEYNIHWNLIKDDLRYFIIPL